MPGGYWPKPATSARWRSITGVCAWRRITPTLRQRFATSKQRSEREREIRSDLFRRFERLRHVGMRVRGGNEQVFVSARMEQHAAREHAFPPLTEQVLVSVTLGVAIVVDGLAREPHLHQRTHADDVRRQARIAQHLGQADAQF